MIAGLEAGRLAELFHSLDHRVPIQHAGYIVGHGGADFTAASGREIGKDRGGDLAGDVREGVAVEEKERRLAMAAPEEF